MKQLLVFLISVFVFSCALKESQSTTIPEPSSDTITRVTFKSIELEEPETIMGLDIIYNDLETAYKNLVHDYGNVQEKYFSWESNNPDHGRYKYLTIGYEYLDVNQDILYVQKSNSFEDTIILGCGLLRFDNNGTCEYYVITVLNAYTVNIESDSIFIGDDFAMERAKQFFLSYFKEARFHIERKKEFSKPIVQQSI